MSVEPRPRRGKASVGPGEESRPVAAMVLTGGASRRMGRDKMEIPVGGVPCAEVVARAARAVAGACVEVGPGRTSLTRVVEREPGRGPLAAISVGWSALVEAGEGGPVLVLAGDLPFVNPELLAWLAGCPGTGSVVPVVERRRQPLLARWSAEALDEARGAAAAGARAVGGRPFGAREVEPGEWGQVTGGDSFADLDTPADVLRLVGPEGLAPPEGVSPPAGLRPTAEGLPSTRASDIARARSGGGTAGGGGRKSLNMDAPAFVDLCASALGVARLTEDEVATVLSLASVAAHASERWAAPLTCWLAGRSGLSPREALALVEGPGAVAEEGAPT